MSPDPRPDIGELRRLAEQAKDGERSTLRPYLWSSGLTYLAETSSQVQLWMDPDDARFIAAVDPGTLLALLDRIEALEAETERLTDALGAAGHGWKVAQKEADEAVEGWTRDVNRLSEQLRAGDLQREQMRIKHAATSDELMRLKEQRLREERHDPLPGAAGPAGDPEPRPVSGWVTAAGGGEVTVVVDRDVESYPRVGARAQVVAMDESDACAAGDRDAQTDG